MKEKLDLKVIDNVKLSSTYGLLKLSTPKSLLDMVVPGQFVEISVNNSKNTFLRRPISICNVEDDTIWLLIRNAGEGTASLLETAINESLDIVMPLGNGFTTEMDITTSILLMGGGVGVAPLLYYGKVLKARGVNVEFLLAAKSKTDLLLVKEFEKYGKLHISTDDGSLGEKGLITHNSILSTKKFDRIACCGPMPMMKAVARYATRNNIECEVSLENLMACGVGACLCCVEDTIDSGHICVCKEGPVINIRRLKWEI